MPRLINREFIKTIKEVTTSKMLDKKNFHKNGLFSEQIFGPLKNYICQCGIYWGPSNSNKKCPTCHVDIVSNRERRKRFAKIVLPIPVVNPIFYDLLISLGKSEIRKPLDLLIKNEKSSLYVDEENNHFVVEENDEKWPPEKFKKYEKSEAIIKLVTWLSEELIDIPDWKYINDHIDSLMINEVLVLPPDLRPTTKIRSKNDQMKSDEINSYYTHLLNHKATIEETNIDILNKKEIYYMYFKQLQKLVNTLYEFILDKLSKKEGLIRGNILGKRIDFSGRAIITPDPVIDIDECSLPYVMILELYKLQISKKLIDYNHFKLQNEAVDYIDECIEMDKLNLISICEEVIKDEVCLLNRQPSLHRLSLLGFKIKMNTDKVIKIHPLACAGFNADFDGDQMAIYLPISKESKEEVLDKFLFTKNLYNPANISLSATPSQDIILGVYILTNNMIPELNKQIEYKNEQITESLKIFNECLPEDYPIIKDPVNKKKLINLLNDINDKYDYTITSKILDDIKMIGYKYSTLYGTTLSLDGLILDNVDELKETIYSKNTSREQLNELASKEIENELRNKFMYSYVIDSGSRGTWEQVRQILLSRGFISNFSGKIIETPVKNNLVEGLTQYEFFNSSYGCRKGLLDVAINTGDSGYLSRQLAFACCNLILDSNLDDCGTEDYLNVFVEDEKKAKCLLYKFYLNGDNEELITNDNLKNIIGKNIKIRSPIFCKSEKVCKRCYGDLHKILHSPFIGMIAAQSLGEASTQLVLRTFHLSLRKNTRILDINNKSFEIQEVYDKVKNGEDFYTFNCSPEGDIYISKIVNAHKDRFEKRMVKVTLDNDEIVECTLDHKFIMQDGTSKEAKDLQVNDQLMPIYRKNKSKLENKNGKFIERMSFRYFIKNNRFVKNIQFIDLPEYEEFYDLTVDSEYPNFALKAGIFIHNSGAAITKKGSEDMLQEDIISDLSSVSKLLHSNKDLNCEELIEKLFKIYNYSKEIHYVHFESVVSQLMWYGNKKWRLLKDRNNYSPEFISILTIPSKESWLLGFGFSNQKKNLLRGISNEGLYSGILDNMLLGRKTNI